jgi:hypothetical protein
MTPERRLDQQRDLSEAAKALGHWLEAAGDHPGPIPTEVWRQIRDAAARVLAAATVLAAEKDGD